MYFIKTKYLFFTVAILTSLTFLSGLILSSSSVSADEDTVVDEINITVPVSCNLTGTGMQSHNATINNGTYVSDIGTTTIKAYCNDKDGFAIYAIGYTDDTDGKNVMTSSTLGSTHDIATGTGTSGNSQWAMKLSTQTNPEPTYPITIQNSYNNYHTVPDDYDLVAKRTASTDIGAAAIGSTLTSTYQIYISNTQSAGTYVGQVKYVMVHPNYVDSEAMRNAVTVVYNGNGLTFPDGSTTNTVTYANVCKPGEYGYVADTAYATVKSSNLNNDGTQNANSPYSDSENILQTITVPNADRLKVVVDYGITANTMGLGIVEGDWDGDWDTLDEYTYYKIYNGENNLSGTKSYTLEGNAVTIYGESWNTPESGYDYGFYVKIYAVYDTEQPNTTGEELPSSECSILPISGVYSETTLWKDRWDIAFNENGVIDYIFGNYDSIKGTTITVYADNPTRFIDVYADANKSKENGYYIMQDLNYSMCSEVDVGQTESVRDVRDSNVYNIAKLADGNCWLIDNLRLDPTDPSVAANLTASNTNATAAAIANYLQGGNNNNEDGWSSEPVAKTNRTLYTSYNIPLVYTGRKKTTADGIGLGSRAIGVFYNYCAATVGTYCYASDSGVDVENTLIDASSDVCPANWRIPIGGAEGEYEALSGHYDNEEETARAFSALLSGSVSYSAGGSILYTNQESGYYWSSTYNDVGKMHLLRTLFASNNYWYYYGNTSGARSNRYSVRCIVSH